MSDQLIPTLAMARDPRLRRLFAFVGLAIREDETGVGMLSARTSDALHGSLLDLAPEYLPPDYTDPDQDDEQWAEMVRKATRR